MDNGQQTNYRQPGGVQLPKKLLVAVIAAATSSQLLAQADVPVQQFKTIVVNATRIEQQADKVTRPLAVVDSETIETVQPQSTAQLLSYQPNISVSGGPRANSQGVNIRGLEGSKVLQTVDGVRQDFESGHRPSYFLDPSLLKSVEVVKGPASSLWGSGALGGVVAQNTVSADDLLSSDQQLGGFVKSGYNDNSHQSSTTVALAGRSDSVDWLLSGYYRDGNDVTLGNSEKLEGSASRDNGALAKAEWQIDDKQSLSFNYRQAEVKGMVPSNAGAEVNGTSNYMINRDQDTNNASLDYRLDGDSPLINTQLMGYWSKVEMSESRVSDGRSDNTKLETYGLNINNLSRIAFSEAGDIELLYGIDGYREDFSSKRGGANRPVPPEATTDVWGSFVQADIPLAERWQLELGVRYDDFETEADKLGEKSSDSDVSPSVALSWQTADWLSLTLRHDQAFRAPSAEEMYSTGAHFCMGPFGCNTFLPNPDLKAEQAANTELLARMNFSDVFAADQLSIEASVFENRVDDFIEQIVTDPDFSNFPMVDPGNTSWVNVDKAKIKGFEIAANYQLADFGAKLAYGQTRGEDDKTGDDLTGIPADTWTADINYGFLQRQITAGVRLIYAADQHRTDYAANSNDTEYDGYTVTDLYASWEPENLSALKVDVTLNNATDKHYRRAWSELDETGRELIVSARYKF